MHVLQLGPYPPPEGGIHRNMLAIREELIKKGHQCSIIATAKSSRIIPEPNVYHPRKPTELIKLLKKLKYDILHLHIGGDINPRVLGLMWICAIFGRGKSILTLHSGGYAAKKVKTASRFSRDASVFRKFGRVIGVNSLMLELFEKFGVKSERARLIYPFALRKPDNNVEVSENLKKFAETHKPFLLTMCLLEDTYDLFMQIDAMEKILEELPEAGLMIVGSGSLENELRKAIASKSYAERIFLTGDIPHSTALHLIELADILLRTTKFDGDAIAVREALFLGTQVIATDNGMRPEGVDLIPISDSKALAEKIVERTMNKRFMPPPETDGLENIHEVIRVYEEICKEGKN